MRQKLLILLAALMLVVAACGADDTSGAEDDAERLTVVATTTIWGDIVSQVVGDAANVEVLFPVGADPHDYQASSSDIETMSNADLVVVNGLQLEEGFLDVIETLEADGANVLEVASLLDPIPFGEGGHDHHDHEGEEGHDDHDHEGEEGHKDDDHDHEGEEGHDHEGEEGHDDHDHEGEEGHDHEGEEGHDHEGEEGHDHEGEEGHKDDDHDHEGEEGHDHEGEEGHDDHDHGDEDPHVWHDPLRIADAVELIAEELAALDSSVDWMANAEAYATELRELDEEVISLLGSVPEDRRKMVTNHDAFGYFADRYDFEVVGTVIPSGSTLADPSSSELAELVEIMTDENIDVIFTETIEPTTLAEAVAAEVGTEVQVVELFTGSLGGPDSDGETYVDMIRTNATRISEALS